MFACTPTQAAENAIRLAGTGDPVAIAEALGLGVYWTGERLHTFGAPAARYKRRIYVLETVEEANVRPLVAEMLGVAVVEIWSIDLGVAGNNRGTAEAKFGREFAAALLGEQSVTG